MKVPRFLWRLIHLGPQIAYAIGLGPVAGRFILLLTTTGRRTGRPRVTPLTFEDRGESILVASARGSSADWYRNILEQPGVGVRIGRRALKGIASVVADPEAIAQYLERQLARRPTFFGAVLRSEGLPFEPTHEQLVRFGRTRPMVEIRPTHDAA